MKHRLNKFELKAINSNDLAFLAQETGEAKKQDFLFTAISQGKIKVIKYLMEQGVSIKSKECINILATKKNKVKIFEYLHSKGISFSPSGSVYVLRSALAISVENTEYLSQFLDRDHNGIYLILNCIVKRDNSSEKKIPIEEYEPILNIMFKKCSPQLLAKVLAIKGSSSKNDEVNKYVHNLYLSINLPNKELNIKKVKI